MKGFVAGAGQGNLVDHQCKPFYSNKSGHLNTLFHAHEWFTAYKQIVELII